MRGWLLGGLSALLLMGTAGTACAQEAGAPSTSVITDEDRAGIDELAQQLDDGVRALGLEVGVDVPSFQPMLAALLGDVFEGLPEGEDYGFSVGFHFAGNSTDDEALEADTERRVVLDTAQACADANGGIAVIQFERIAVDDMVGYRCILAGPGTEDPESWVFLSAVVLASPDRHLDVRLGAAAASETGGLARATEVGSSQLDDLIALAAGIERIAIDTYVGATSE